MALNEFYGRTIMNGLRKDWTFEYTARDLAAAAIKQREDRTARKKRWEDQYASVMAEVKASGIEVSESLANAVSNSTYGRGPQVMVRADLQTKLSECHSRIQTHDNAAREYDAWSLVLAANEEARLKLNHADWLYFFGGLSVEDEDDE